MVPVPILFTLRLLIVSNPHNLTTSAGPGGLLNCGERLPDERRDLPDIAGRVVQHLLVPQEQHGVRAGLARVPVAQHVVPDGAAQAAAIAGGLEQLGEWEVGLDPSGEVLHGNPSGPCMPFVNPGTISAVQFEKMSGNLL
jgi:hypothetical protein